MKENSQRKGLHLHRVTPIIFGGDPKDRQNLTLVSRLQHAELTVFWNRMIKERKNKSDG